MIDEEDRARHPADELDDRPATGRHERGLRSAQRWVEQRGLRIDDVPVRADGVEVRVEVQPGVDEVDAGPLADLHVRGIVAGERAHGAVEDDEGGLFVGDGLPIGLDQPGLGARWCRYSDCTTYNSWSTGGSGSAGSTRMPPYMPWEMWQGTSPKAQWYMNMPGYSRRASMVARLARGDRRIGRAATLAGHGVEVDVVRHLVAFRGW